MPEKISPIHRIDYASLKLVADDVHHASQEPHPALTTSLPSHIDTRKKAAVFVAGQLWQLNKFVQSVHKENENNLLHAKRTHVADVNGKVVENIVLYARPKAENRIASFLDGFWYGRDQELAREVLSTFARAGDVQGAVPNSVKSSVRALCGLKDTPKLILQTKHCQAHLQTASNAIATEKLGMTDVVLEISSGLRDRIRGENNFTQWAKAINLPEAANNMLESLETINLVKYKFSNEEIEAFQKLVHDIRDEHKGDPAHSVVIMDFCTRWMAQYNDGESTSFRKFVHSNKQYRAWHVVAYYVVEGNKAVRNEPPLTSIVPCRLPAYPEHAKPVDQQIDSISTHWATKFDLAEYTEYKRVLAPPLTDWAPLSMIGTEVSTLYATQLYQDVGATGFSRKQGIRKDQLVSAARGIHIDPEQSALNEAQEKQICLTYKGFIGESLKSGEPFLLTPLFNYTKKTIDACIAAMLAPLELHLRLGHTLPKVAFFTTDQRVRAKFDEKLDALQRTFRKERAVPTEPQVITVTTPAKDAPVPLAIETSTVQQATSSHAPDQASAPHENSTRAASPHEGVHEEPASTVQTPTDLQATPPQQVTASAVTNTASPATRRGIDLVTLQKGITLKDWNQADAIMLTKSAGEYGTIKTKAALDKRAVGNEFPDAGSDIRVIKRSKGDQEKQKRNSSSQYFFLAGELGLPFAPSSGSPTLSPKERGDIAATYSKIINKATLIEKAVTEEARTVVLVPCFDLEHDNEARRQAIKEMFNSLHVMLTLNDKFKVTLAVKSDEDKQTLEQELANWRKQIELLR
jgi:hypothetical protein